MGENYVCVQVCVCVWGYVSPKLNHVVTKSPALPPPPQSPRPFSPGLSLTFQAAHCPKVRLDYWPKPCEGSPQWPQLIFYTNFGLMRGLQHCVNTATEKAPATQS